AGTRRRLGRASGRVCRNPRPLGRGGCQAKQVRQWVDERKDQIELHYLPPYSPEANPDEWLNRDLKTELRLRPAALDKTGLKRMAEDFMRQLSSTPRRVARYFNSVSIRYAA
ncbi:transposase, partial [Sphaerotilus sp. FB-3]|uniref:transposase n=1 Tax=Sphaerotilus sp. FB-3 TaxID=2913396 RepID=UPI00283AA750